MKRPRSIILFEWTFIIATALSFVALVIDYSTDPAAFAIEKSDDPLAIWVSLAVIAFFAVVSWALWYGVARRASVVAKWLVVAFFVLGTGAVTFAWIYPEPNTYIANAIDTLACVLNGVAAWALFRADALDWFAGRPVDLEETFR